MAEKGVARTFGDNLRRLREERGLTQEVLGFRADMHRTNVGLMERGMTVPRIDTMLKLAAALGVKCESPLFDGISWSCSEAGPASGAFTISTPREENLDASQGAAQDG